MAWIDEIKARIGLYVGSQGNQAGLSGLAELLNDIADKANEGGGGGDGDVVVVSTLQKEDWVPGNHTGKDAIIEALGITEAQYNSILANKVLAIDICGMLLPLSDGGGGSNDGIYYAFYGLYDAVNNSATIEFSSVDGETQSITLDTLSE